MRNRCSDDQSIKLQMFISANDKTSRVLISNFNAPKLTLHFVSVSVPSALE